MLAADADEYDSPMNAAMRVIRSKLHQRKTNKPLGKSIEDSSVAATTGFVGQWEGDLVKVTGQASEPVLPT